MKSKSYCQKVGQIWLARAQEDILYAEGNFKLGFYTQVCFLCQQSAEKALKAFLRRNGEKITRKFKIHLLPILLERCVKIDKALAFTKEIVSFVEKKL